MKILHTGFLLTGLLITFLANGQSLELKLFELPDVIFERIPVPKGYESAYKLMVKQPIDHENPSKGHFYQRVWLSHKGMDRPNVMVTNGYEAPYNRISELGKLLDANQISVEHRYFGKSIPQEIDVIPEKIDYQYLNLKQATADLHHIRELISQIYSGKWVSTGISKGGQTTIFYRYFYPDDVAASVPYVAPLNLAFEDERIYAFLDTVGSDECREAIYDFQVRILKNRKKILPMLKWYSKGKGHSYQYLSLEEAFEYSVLEYPFSFWQWGEDCADIPSREAPLDEQLDYLLDVIEIGFFADKDILGYASHYYQAASEMGYYGYDTEDFKKYLKALPIEPHPHAAFSPVPIKKEFDPSFVNQVNDWLKVNGDEFIYIYGGMDTWSATRVEESGEVDALWFILPDADHRTARINNLNDANRQEMIKKLESWLDMEIE